MGGIRGRLGRPLGRSNVTAARVDGHSVRPPTRIWLTRDTVVEAMVDDTWVPAVVHIRCADETGFWASVARDDLPPQPDDLLLKLLTDLRRVRDSRYDEPDGPAAPGRPETGRFDIPQVLWLNLVARHRRRLPRAYPDLQLAIHSRLVPAERRVATAVLRTQPGLDSSREATSSNLLAAMTAHLRYLDSQDANRESAQ